MSDMLQLVVEFVSQIPGAALPHHVAVLPHHVAALPHPVRKPLAFRQRSNHSRGYAAIEAEPRIS